MEIVFRTAGTTDIDVLIRFMQAYYEFDDHPFNESFVRTTLEDAS